MRVSHRRVGELVVDAARKESQRFAGKPGRPEMVRGGVRRYGDDIAHGIKSFEQVLDRMGQQSDAIVLHVSVKRSVI